MNNLDGRFLIWLCKKLLPLIESKKKNYPTYVEPINIKLVIEECKKLDKS